MKTDLTLSELVPGVLYTSITMHVVLTVSIQKQACRMRRTEQP